MPKRKEDRLSIRADANQKSVLAQAARARNMNVSQFVLQVSLREAEQVIAEEAQIVVSTDEYDWIAKIMDEATPAPRLREALNQPPAWDV
jgi:uncharacterized protein (DUF1778 family)